MFKLLFILLWPFRIVAGALIRAYDRLVVPTSLIRPAELQSQVDQETRALVLYHFEACPFCVKVRRHIKRLGLQVQMRDIKRNPAFMQELVQGGGEAQAPCLRISTQGEADRWMYESSDINEYLSLRFAR